MTSFYKLWEDAKVGRDFWTGGLKNNDAESDPASKQMVLRGLEIRADREEGSTFWDDFISVMTGNSEGASKLLNVSQDTIAKWPQTIRELMKKVRDENAEKERSDIIKTGKKTKSAPQP